MAAVHPFNYYSGRATLGSDPIADHFQTKLQARANRSVVPWLLRFQCPVRVSRKSKMYETKQH
jgi:hypothetical protein